MKALALVLLLSAPSYADFQWITPLHKSAEPICEPPVDVAPNQPKVESKPPQKKLYIPEFDYESDMEAVNSLDKYVFKVRASNGSAVSGGGTAISIGDGRLVSASHVIHGIPNAKVEVLVDGEWYHASYATVRGADVMNLRIRRKDLPSVARRNPKYLEPVVVIGAVTGDQPGTYVNKDTVALIADVKGIKDGDSGGGVFGADGKLLGTMRGINPDNPRVVFFTETDVSLNGVRGGSPAPIINYGPFANTYAVNDSVVDSDIVTINGRKESVNQIIGNWYKGGGYWSHNYNNGYRMPINTHLTQEHGIPAVELSGLSNDTKEKLHSALHERDEAAPRQRVQYSQPQYRSSYNANCPNGNCPLKPANTYQRPQRQGFLRSLFN